MKEQIAELNSQMNVLNAAAREVKPNLIVSTTDIKAVPAGTAEPPLTLKTSLKSDTKTARSYQEACTCAIMCS